MVIYMQLLQYYSTRMYLESHTNILIKCVYSILPKKSMKHFKQYLHVFIYDILYHELYNYR